MFRRMKNYLQFVVILAAVLYAVYLFQYRGMTIRDILGYAQNNRFKMLVTIWSLYAFKACCTIIPYSGLVLAAALSFPLYQAIGVSLVGTVLCFSISYFFGRMTKKDRLEKKMSENRRIAPFMIGAKEHEWSLCFANHIAGLSSEVLGMLFGMMRTPYSVYLTASLAGVLPGMLCVSIAGKMDGLRDWRFYLFYGMNLTFTLIGYGMMLWRVVKIRRESKNDLQGRKSVAEDSHSQDTL